MSKDMNNSHAMIVDRSIRLFSFLKEITSLRLATIRDIDRYDQVVWLSELPRERGWYCAAWQLSLEANNEVWIDAKKPNTSKCPVPGEDLLPWMDENEIENPYTETFPSIKDTIYETFQEENNKGELEDRVRSKSLADHPKIKQQWEKYIDEQWLPWSENTKRLKPVLDVYAKLFSIYQKQLRLGESFEVILGIGFLTWTTPSGYEVRRHILISQTEMSFDSAKGLITVTAAGDGAKLSLEQDMLEAKDRVDEDQRYSSLLSEFNDDIWDKTRLDTILTSWVNDISSEGRYQDTLNRQASSQNFPSIHFAPALILRKRTERNLLGVFGDIIEKLKSDREIPKGIESIVRVIDTQNGRIESDEDFSNDEKIRDSCAELNGESEIYFPLPSNDQQRSIVKKLEYNHGVLVQGPPGTGKSQTIANLICHLLAQGKKVLVTSQTARALESLRDKIPDDVAPLCVSLLGNDYKALQALEDSVLGITNRYNTWNERGSHNKIRTLTKELHESRTALAEIRRNLREIRESETLPQQAPSGNYRGKLSHIAKRIREEESRYLWIAPYSTDASCPLTNTEAQELLHLLSLVERSEYESLKSFDFSIDSIPIPTEFEELKRNEDQNSSLSEAATQKATDPNFIALSRITEENRENLLSVTTDFRVKLKQLQQHIQPWVPLAIKEILGERDRIWRDIKEKTQEQLSAAEKHLQQADSYHVQLPDDLNVKVLRKDVETILEHLQSGGKLGFWIFRTGTIKKTYPTIKNVTIDGKRVDNLESLKKLHEWSKVAECFLILRELWIKHIKLDNLRYSALYGEYGDLCEPLDDALQLYSELVSIRDLISNIPGLVPPIWHDSAELDAFLDILNAASVQDKARHTEEKFEALRRSVCEKIDRFKYEYKCVHNLRDAISERDIECYRNAYQETAVLLERKKNLGNCIRLIDKLRSISPDLADELLASSDDDIWKEQLGEFEQAWAWAAVDRWLTKLADPEIGEVLAHDSEQKRIRIEKLIAELAAEHSWQHCFSRMTERERQHLMAWTQNMKKIGKGTGKFASKHRAAARKNMEECRSAIPAWIMPIYRVVESVKPERGSYDFIIVDEASQSGCEALFLEYLAEKIIVVGDDKQISPSHIGSNREEVIQFRKKFIGDLPHCENIGLDDSFFDLAMIRFPGYVRLREHFRCMPEIIQFSNNQFYKAEPLIPLKQYTADRLEPIKTIFVEGGYEKGESVKAYNPIEAEHLVDAVATCCEQPEYLHSDGSKKTIGVISLRSTSSQAAEIEKLLLERLGPEEYQARRLICGDPYDLQGDERDIIFLTMVTAPKDGGRIGSLSHNRYARAFNVAASRAKEQMWLFHSVSLNDLSPTCYRYKLLEYAKNPKIDRLEWQGGDITWDRKIDPFDSLFEQRIFLKITERGYHVVPQYEVAGKRIDLVVTGVGGKLLAVECDGDEWHGPDQYDNDMARQRQLERCGWKFWRIRESTFYREPDESLEDLWKTLTNMRIYPAAINIDTDESSYSACDMPSFGVEQDLGDPLHTSDNTPISNQQPEFQEHEEIDSTFLPESQNQNMIPNLTVNNFEVLPYRHWKQRPLTDPRIANSDEILEALLEIVAAEGPIQCFRAFRIYAKAAGIGRVGRQIENIFVGAIDKALRTNRLLKRQEFPENQKSKLIVRVPGVPEVLIREAANRTLEEIPPSELGAVMCLITPDIQIQDSERVFRQVLAFYGMKRLTKNTKNLLEYGLKEWAVELNHPQTSAYMA